MFLGVGFAAFGRLVFKIAERIEGSGQHGRA
jgi:hypothetical protein